MRYMSFLLVFLFGCAPSVIVTKKGVKEYKKRAQHAALLKADTVRFSTNNINIVWPEMTQELFVEKGLEAQFEPGYTPLPDFFTSLTRTDPAAHVDGQVSVEVSVRLWNVHRGKTVDEVVLFMEPSNHCSPMNFRQAVSWIYSNSSPLDEWKENGPKRLPYIVAGGTRVSCPGVTGDGCFCHPLIGRSKGSDTVFFKWVNADPSMRECDVNTGLLEKWNATMSVGVVLDNDSPLRVIISPTSQPASQPASQPSR